MYNGDIYSKDDVRSPFVKPPWSRQTWDLVTCIYSTYIVQLHIQYTVQYLYTVFSAESSSIVQYGSGNNKHNYHPSSRISSYLQLSCDLLFCSWVIVVRRVLISELSLWSSNPQEGCNRIQEFCNNCITCDSYKKQVFCKFSPIYSTYLYSRSSTEDYRTRYSSQQHRGNCYISHFVGGKIIKFYLAI
jgi:hypothetical protein